MNLEFRDGCGWCVVSAREVFEAREAGGDGEQGGCPQRRGRGMGGVQGCSVKQRGDEGEPAGETEWWPARTGKPG